MSEPLSVAGEPGRRVVGSASGPELTEHGVSGWIILRPSRTWDEWRQFAHLILAAVPPE
jgi:hypothetical protein